jgi:thiol-disulfide isomerase/thioredoxin
MQSMACLLCLYNKPNDKLMRSIILIAAIFFSFYSFAQTKYLKDRIKDQKYASRAIGLTISSTLKSTDNKSITLKDYKGNYIVIDFWFTKCIPCFRQFPFMDSIKQKFKEDSLLTFMNICSESSLEEWKQIVIDRKVSGINLFDDNTKIQKTSIIGAPKPSGRGIIHDQLYLDAYPSYAFIDSTGKVLGVTTVAPSDSLLFTYYIDGLLKNRNLEESLNNFKSEIHSDKLGDEFLLFIKNRFNLNDEDSYKLVAPYRKLL